MSDPLTNHSPLALAVSGTVSEDGPTLTVAADFTDVDASDTHSFTVDTTGTLGSVTNVGDGTFVYDPAGAFEHLAAGESATDTFTYTVDDGNGGTSSETVTITVTGVNDAPVALAVSGTVSEDGPTLTVAADFTDADASDTHTFTVNTTGTLGSVTNVGDGTFVYDPAGAFEHLAAGESATDTFTYTVDDGNGGTSSETVTITVTGVNDAPVALAVSGTVSEDGPTLTVAADFTDVDASDTHTFTIDTTGTLGSVTNVGDGTFVYDPGGAFEHLAAGESATDTFTYTVDDGNGGTSSETVTITVTGVNDAPVALAVYGTVSEDGPTLTVAADFTDVDASDTHSFTVDTTGTLGSVTNVGDGTFVYDPAGAFEHLAAGESATDTFTYTVNDGNGGTSSETVTITVTGVNDAPVALAVSGTVSEDGPTLTVAADFSDADASDTHTFTVNTTGTLGSVTNVGDGTFVYDPAGAFEHLAAGESATDTFTYTVDDGQGGTSSETVTITVTGMNDAPVALAVSGTVSEDGPTLTVAADFTDVDASDTHTFTVNTTGTLGSVTNVGDGTFVYDPAGAFEHLAAGESATDTFTYTVDDGNGGTSSETVTITVTGVNDAPVALAVSGTVSEDGPTLTVAADFTDVDASDTHTFTIDTTGTLGSVTNVGDGTFVYDPGGAFEHLAAGESATDTFTYTVDDGNGGTSSETVTITVTGVNDAPVALAVYGTVSEDGPTLTVAADFTDADASDTHSFTIDTTGTLGSVTNVGDGTFVYDPAGAFEHLAAGESATDTFTYTVNDGNGGTSTETVTITVTGQVEAIKLIASDGDTLDSFGYATAVNDLAVGVVGARGDDDGGNGAGAVYVYTPNGSQGFDQVKLTASDATAGAAFGYSTAINTAGTVAVGAFLDGENGYRSGAVYVYEPDGNGGYVETKLMASDGTPQDRFGMGVSINDAGVVAVGASYAMGAVWETGAVYVYEPNGAGGYDETKLVPSDGWPDDRFGYPTVINDAGVVFVGSRMHNDGAGSDSGAVYLFHPDGAGGYTESKLTASDGTALDYFGVSGGVNDAGTVAVGAYGVDANGTDAGAIYVYEPDGAGGYIETRILASDGAAGDNFGWSVAINDDGVIVASGNRNDDAGSNSGSAYVYIPDGTGGYSEVKLTAPDASAGDSFSYSVAINADGVVMIGATAGDGQQADSGAVYVYTPDGLGGYVGPDGTVYQPTVADLAVTGTTGADMLAAGTGDDELDGLAGDDLLAGGAGSDVLTGGTGADIFQFKSLEAGHDVVTDFDVGAGDILEFESATFASFSEVMLAAQDDGTDTTIAIDADTSVRLDGVVVSALSSDDFSFV
ncbi:Ig-like domain-containing protein [Stappia sp.]|uniref:beta strand repeat-containing protein n=1 Tax=Stappia sp. TaxID=1870903 RepID=UPI0032D9797C